jgi:hypothetical protein
MPVAIARFMSSRVAVPEESLARLLRRWHLRCEDTNSRGGVESQKRKRIALLAAELQEVPAGASAEVGPFSPSSSLGLTVATDARLTGIQYIYVAPMSAETTPATCSSTSAHHAHAEKDFGTFLRALCDLLRPFRHGETCQLRPCRLLRLHTCLILA